MTDNKTYGWPTTRCYPRTTLDAFKDGDYYEWWFPHEKSWQDQVLFGISVLAWVGLGIYFWRTL